MSIGINNKGRDPTVARQESAEEAPASRKRKPANAAQNIAQNPKTLTPQSDPFSEAMREATDADSDMERAGSGRVRREGVKEDDGDAAREDDDPKVEKKTGETHGQRGGSSQTKRIQERERAAEASAPTASIEETSIVERSSSPIASQAKAAMETISLTKDGAASYLLERAYDAVKEIVDGAGWERKDGGDSAINENQMLSSKRVKTTA